MDSLDKKRSEALGILIKKQEQELADKKKKEEDISKMIVEASQFAPSDILANANAISKKGGSPLEVAQALGKYSGDYLKNELLKAQIKTEKDKSASILPTTGTNSQYNDIVNTILGSGKFTKDQTLAIKKGIAIGENPVTIIKNQAKNILGQTEATKITNFEVAKNAMQDLSSALSQFYALGGKTGIFSGNFEKVVNNLGSVQDPQLVDLATQIQAQLQIYRNAVSGTAYSVQEGKDIASVFPGINKSQGLNEAIIGGRMKAFDSVIDGSYRTALGSSYDKLKEIQNTSTDNPFAKSLGTTNQTIQGTSILTISPSGTLEFNIPKK